jgi:hypothetical protein
MGRGRMSHGRSRPFISLIVIVGRSRQQSPLHSTRTRPSSDILGRFRSE